MYRNYIMYLFLNIKYEYTYIIGIHFITREIIDTFILIIDYTLYILKIYYFELIL